MGSCDQVCVAFLYQVLDYGTPNQTIMTGNVDFGIWIHFLLLQDLLKVVHDLIATFLEIRIFMHQFQI